MNLPVQPSKPHALRSAARTFLYVRGEPVRRCRVRCMTKGGIFIETDTKLVVGATVELAFTRSHTRQLVSVARRSAKVARSSESGAAILFFATRKAWTRRLRKKDQSRRGGSD